MKLKFDILELADRLEPRIRQAFLDSIDRIRSRVVIKDLESAVSSGNAARVVQVLGLEEAAFEPLSEALREAMITAGNSAGQAVPPVPTPGAGTRGVFFFSGRNLRVEEILRRQSGRLISGIVEDQKEAIRIFLEAGLIDGSNPRTTALELVGRLNRATGRREGGVLGLTSRQVDYVLSARRELASTDPELLRNYLKRSLRDRRYDRAVLNAIKTGRPIDPDTARVMAERYNDRLLKHRADNVARTETISSLHRGQYEAMLQLVEGGRLRSDEVSLIWRATGDTHTRDSHSELDGQSIHPNEVFTSILGSNMRFPGDNELGALAEDIINCRCWAEIDINYLKVAQRGG